MIVEQIRYFIREEDRALVLEARREVGRLRLSVGVPPGQILVADAGPESAPAIIWQCSYPDEGAMGMAEAVLIGNAEYETARERLGALASRVELELYMDDDTESGG